MARATDAVTSESENEHTRSGSTKKKYSLKKARRASSDGDVASEVEKGVQDEKVEQPAESNDEGEEEEEGEEEYEIEQILDAKKGHFPHGRFGYLVKWKGYGPEHNSWVDEEDAGNAKELIDQYWANKKKHKSAPRKSEPSKIKAKSVEKPSRKSLGDVSTPEAEPHQKKRGRPKKAEGESEKDEIEDDEDDRVKKRPRKSNGASRKAKPESDDDEEKWGSMSKHMTIPSWENIIESVDTVERDEKGELLVYFKIKNDKIRRRENSRLCAQKFPQKLILFYESNLRWKTDGEPADSD